MKKAVAAIVKNPSDKYSLRDIHREIDLYDRKIEYLNRFEEFASDAEREKAEKALVTKRAPLEKRAKELAALGVEFAEQDLPRSFRAGGEKTAA